MASDATYLTETYHIVGDKAFPLKKHILTPYKKNQKRRRTRAQKRYNKHLASKRQVSEYLYIYLLSDMLVNICTFICFLIQSYLLIDFKNSFVFGNLI